MLIVLLAVFPTNKNRPQVISTGLGAKFPRPGKRDIWAGRNEIPRMKSHSHFKKLCINRKLEGSGVVPKSATAVLEHIQFLNSTKISIPSHHDTILVWICIEMM